MELIAALVVAGPLGYFCRSRRRGLGIYLAVWAVIFPIQTIVVHSADPDDVEPLYFVLNAAILALGIALNALGARLRASRARGGAVRPQTPTVP